MHKLKLTKTHTTSTGSVHASITLDDKDIGMLYLSQHEADLLLKALRYGAKDEYVQLDIEHNILIDDSNDEEYFEDEDL